MSTKTITLGEDAYDRLRALKHGNESFTEVVLRLTSDFDITRLAGILTEDEGNRLDVVVKEGRELSKRREKRLDAMFK
jgi:predicted CopG family antitoxin